jgi:hypothetical protein
MFESIFVTSHLKYLLLYTKKELFSSFILLPEPWINITIDFDSITDTFQDIRYIGELRERWKEIKLLLRY